MKKILYSSVAVLFAAIAATSCSKEANVPQADDNLVDVTIIAGNPETESATKTEIVGTTPYWSVGDAIGVSDGTSTNYKFTTDIAAKAQTASFTGGTEVSSTLYAYYPYTNNGVGQVSEKYGAKVDLPANQQPSSTSFDGAADIMVSKQFTVDPKNATVENLEFARLGAVVKIVLVDKESSMTGAQHPAAVSMTASSNLAGRVLVNMKDQSLGAPYYNQSKTVTANYTSETKYVINGTNASYLIVVPQTLEAGSSLTIEASTEGYSIEKEITVPAGGIKLEAGKITTLQIGLGASNIKASAGAALPFVDNMDWADNGTEDDGTDFSTSISEKSNGLYVSASKVYKGKGGLKLGTSKASGSITTKELDLSGEFYIAIEGARYGSDTGNLVVSVDETVVIEDAYYTSYVNIPAGTYTNKSKVTIKTSSKRGYLYDVKIKSGTYVIPPVINVTSEKTMEVPNGKGLYAIEYNISNPIAGKSISAVADVTWIKDFDYSTPGEVSFEVEAQAAAALARSGKITLSYDGADDVVVTVNQAAGAGGTADFAYIFTSKSWAATRGGVAANWTSGKAGAGFSNNGIQVTTSSTGANGTSVDSFTSVSKVVVTYNTNKSAGAGTLSLEIGDNTAHSADWAYSGSGDGREANYTCTFNIDTPESGKVKLTVNTKTNSIYVVSVTVTAAGIE